LNASETNTPLHSAPQFNKVSLCWGLRFVAAGLKTPKKINKNATLFFISVKLINLKKLNCILTQIFNTGK